MKFTTAVSAGLFYLLAWRTYARPQTSIHDNDDDDDGGGGGCASLQGDDWWNDVPSCASGCFDGVSNWNDPAVFCGNETAFAQCGNSACPADGDDDDNDSDNDGRKLRVMLERDDDDDDDDDWNDWIEGASSICSIYTSCSGTATTTTRGATTTGSTASAASATTTDNAASGMAVPGLMMAAAVGAVGIVVV